MTIKDRIKAFCKEEGITVTAFENSINVSNGYVNAISKNVGPDKLEAIVEKYSKINLEWLLTGRGPMLKGDVINIGDGNASTQNAGNNSTITNTTNNYKGCGGADKKAAQDISDISDRVTALEDTPPDNTKTGIPLIPLDAVAGFPAADTGAAYPENCTLYDIPEFAEKGANFLIRVSGDSMTPIYDSGDIIACRKIADIRFFQWGTVYVLETSQGILVKRVMESEQHDDCILCVSENSEVHKPFLLPKDDIRSLSTIVGLIRLV